ncbi:MAG: tetratricopeptide repeat protein, partial [Alphaproteobacteria bacterium]
MNPHPEIRPLIEKALGAHQAGHLNEALALYRQAIDRAPDHPDALALGGIACCQAGRLDEGIGLLQRAAAVRPGSLDTQYNLAHAFETADRLEEAAHAYRNA